MAIDQKLLNLRNEMKDSPEDDGREPVAPEPPLPADRHQGCVALKGTWKQRKWATDLRNVALGLKWSHENAQLLRTIHDATWWIANKSIAVDMKFKPPVETQCSVVTLSARPTPTAEVLAKRTEVALQSRAEAQRFVEAEKFAESVSKDPKLAKAAILAVLSRLYRDSKIKDEMRSASRAALAAADHDDADLRDIDAIERMLKS